MAATGDHEGRRRGDVCEARLIDGLSDEELRSLFNAARDADYHAIAEEARSVAQTARARSRTPPGPTPGPGLPDLGKRLSEIVAIDFFGANGRESAEACSRSSKSVLQDKEANMPRGTAARASRPGSLKGRIWVTRKGVHVDRIASAWLIRRFIDPDAPFVCACEGLCPRTGRTPLRHVRSGVHP